MDNDLISRSAAIDALMGQDELTRSVIRRVLIQVPEVDAVEVVRCKDCVSGELCLNLQGAEYVVCELDENHVWLPNDFCSYGERREDNAAD